jgi:hypothetical protein
MKFKAAIIAVGVCSGLVSLLLIANGCSKAKDPLASSSGPLKPKEAASQLHHAFAEAPPEVKQAATAASEAIQSADYERAVDSIRVIKSKPNLSLDQGLAVHATEVSLEARLISAMATGDPKAKQAYEALKKSRKN